MLRTRIILFLMGFFLCAGASASELDLNISDEAFELEYAATPTAGGARSSAGVVHHEDDIFVGNLGLHLVDNAGSEMRPVNVGLGGKLLFVDGDLQSGGALAIGAFGRFNLTNANRIALAGGLHYAPEVTSFGDLEGYLEFDARIEYEVLRNASIYLGYRKIRGDFELTPGNVTLDSGVHFGMNFRF